MKHNEVEYGMLRAYLDGEMKGDPGSALKEHAGTCSECQAELTVIHTRAAGVRAGLDYLPQPAHVDSAAAWSAFRTRINQPGKSTPMRWSPWRTWSLAAGGAVAVAVALVVTVAPFRAWAESLLSIFRVEHVTVLDINPDIINNLTADEVFNQAMTRIVSDEVTVTEAPQKPQPVADAATASKLAGFPVHLLAGQTPAVLMVRNTITAQLKLDRDRLQSILDEAGRSDLRIPSSVDGAVIGMRVPAGILAGWGNCGDWAARWRGAGGSKAVSQPEDSSCVRLNELPSPTASVPQQIDPAEIARVALQFAGLSANEAANFTQTVDWTTTFVLPILHGQSSYEKVSVGGEEGVLLRPKGPAPTSRFDLVWVENGILYSLMGTGDDTTALNLASQIE